MRLRDEDEKERTVDRDRNQRISLTIEGQTEDYQGVEVQQKQVRASRKQLSIDVEGQDGAA